MTPGGADSPKASCTSILHDEPFGTNSVEWGMYQAMKQTTLAVSSRLPKPPNTHPTTLRSVRLGGGEIRFAPNCAARRCACAASRPVCGATARRRSASSTDTWCQSSSDKSIGAETATESEAQHLSGPQVEQGRDWRSEGLTFDGALGRLAAMVRFLAVFQMHAQRTELDGETR